ncbi:MAG: hypothetical protein IKQ92_12950 [Clostridia bacterium]|nr:hypothetical protein [Clostridia bacterium]
MKKTITVRLLSYVLVSALLLTGFTFPAEAADEHEIVYAPCVSNICNLANARLICIEDRLFMTAGEIASVSGYSVREEGINGVSFARGLDQYTSSSAVYYSEEYWLPMEETLGHLQTGVCAIRDTLAFRGKECTAYEMFDYIRQNAFTANNDINTSTGFLDSPVPAISGALYDILFSGNIFSKAASYAVGIFTDSGSFIEERYTDILYKTVYANTTEDLSDLGYKTLTDFEDINEAVRDPYESILRIDSMVQNDNLYDDDFFKQYLEYYAYTDEVKTYQITDAVDKALDPGAEAIEAVSKALLGGDYVDISGMGVADLLKAQHQTTTVINCADLPRNMIMYTFFDGPGDTSAASGSIPSSALSLIDRFAGYWRSDTYLHDFLRFGNGLLDIIKKSLVSSAGKTAETLLNNYLTDVFNVHNAKSGLLLEMAASIVGYIGKRAGYDKQMDYINHLAELIELQSDAQTKFYKSVAAYPSDMEAALKAKYCAIMYLRYAQICADYQITAKIPADTWKEQCGRTISHLLDISDCDLTYLPENEIIPGNDFIEKCPTEPAPWILVTEASHTEEPVPRYPDVYDFKREFSVPAIYCPGENVAAFNDKLLGYCQRIIDDFHRPENDDLITRVWFTFQTENAIAAINIHTGAAVAYSGYGWGDSRIFYYDSANDGEIEDWREYVSRMGYHPDLMKKAIKDTDVYIGFTTSDDSWEVKSPEITGVMIGETESEVTIFCSYNDWEQQGSQTFTLEIPTSQLLEKYGK